MLVDEVDIETAQAYLRGELCPIEAARRLSHLAFEDDLPKKLAEAANHFMVVDSETDAIPIGPLRDEWHPEVRAAADEKYERAVEWAKPLVALGCEGLVRFADSLT